MRFYEIDKLKRDTKQDNLYNMFQVTYRDFQDPTRPLNPLEVMEEETMRMDLLSKRVYLEDSYIDVLCHVNSIDNPLNIMAGDNIFYPLQGFIETLKTDDVYVEAVPGLLLNAEKTTAIDENRKQYVEANYSLTPTANPVPKESVRIVGESIVIGERN